MKWDFRSGDILAYGGRDLVGRIIRFGTCSRFSHVGMICKTDFTMSKLTPVLFESTSISTLPCIFTGKKVSGVQGKYPVDSIADYPGRVYWYRYRGRGIDEHRLEGFLLSQIGKEYDMGGAICSGFRLLDRFTDENLDTLFCSELVAKALEVMGDIDPGAIPGRFNPGELMRYLRLQGTYEQAIRLK